LNNYIQKEVWRLFDRNEIQDIYSLSALQQGMLLSYAVNPQTEAYIEQFDFTLTGALCPRRINDALNRVIEKYDALRTIFSYKKTDEPKQIVLKRRKTDIQVQDFRNDQDAEKSVELFKNEDRIRGFDLGTDILIRCSLLRVKDNTWHLLLTFHHIIMDGWSFNWVIRDLMIYYGEDDNIEPVKELHPYKEYIAWLENQDKEQAEKYWTAYLEGYEQPAGIPLNKNHKTGRQCRYRYCLEPSLVEKIIVFAKQKHLTVNTLLKTAWGIMMQKYHNTRDVVYGEVVSGRPPQLKGMDTMVGLMINTRPIRILSREEDTYELLCRRVHEEHFTSIPYEYYSLHEIQSKSSLKNKLISYAMAFENYPSASAGGQTEDQEFYFTEIDVIQNSDYDFSIIINPGIRYEVTFMYHDGAFSLDTMKELEQSFHAVLTTVLENPEVPVAEIGICSEAQLDNIKNIFNKEPVYQNEYKTIDQMFADQVKRSPNHPAAGYRNHWITYAELNQAAHNIALRLTERGVGHGDRVGLLADRGIEPIAAMLGILKCGASYVPLDPVNGTQRLLFMIEDAQIKTICISLDGDRSSFEAFDLLDIRSCMKECLTAALKMHHSTESEAYLMYTSGSTGNPKGCRISHRNVMHLLLGQDYMDFADHEVYAAICTYAFDASIIEIWGALLYGKKLLIIDPEEIGDPDRLAKTFRQNHADFAIITPALVNRITQQNMEVFSGLKTLIIGGDIFPLQAAKKIKQHIPGICVLNAYGPTENTMISTICELTSDELEKDKLTIGRPLNNGTAYILDRYQNILPIGAVGELCVGGAGVGRGYFNRPELNREKFIRNLFYNGDTVYRTGDLAKWLPDGTIDFIGRFDNQVKIRGYRIELGEIESVLNELFEYEQLTVQVREVDHDKQICVYYVSATEANVREWKNRLKTRLPGYMIPALFIRIDALPLTANGKIMASELKKIPIKATAAAAGKVLDSYEKTIKEILESVLNLNSINVDDHFFDIGANSLNLLTVTNRLKKLLNRDIPLTAVFQYTTIRQLADFLKHKDDYHQEPSPEREELNATLRQSVLLMPQREEN